QVLPLFGSEPLEHGPAARIFGEIRRASVELETAPLGRNGNPQRVARKDQLGCRAADRAGLATGPAFFARAVDLYHRLGGGEAARRRDFLHERFDVRAQELRRLMAGRANQMEMPRVPI